MKDAILLANAIKEAITIGLPGEEAHLRMLPEGRKLYSSTSYKDSAVLILLFPKSGEWWTVFMKRNQYDGPHSGQVSFPGGKKDTIDKTLLETALRETCEETGIDTSGTIIAGPLSPLQIPVSGFIVHPFIAVMNHLPEFSPDKNEVEYLIEVPLRELISPSASKYKQMLIRNADVNVPYFDIQNEVIWGATAMILSEFLQVYKRIISDL
jgi:8-oxo-dGTP pyrophosphatase MutT (NUDIX family)